MKSIRRSKSLLFGILLCYVGVLFWGCFVTAVAEHAPWDCSECGRTGNTGQYCGGCSHPAPWMDEGIIDKTGTVEYLGERYAATAQGFAGPVKVFMTLDENRTIVEFSIGDEKFAEVLGSEVQGDEFLTQFIGKKLPVMIGDIDAITGVTITTRAVMDAINQIAVALE